MKLSDQMEAFIITNGRKTFDHAFRLLQGQSLGMKITVLRDMKWIDALNEINRSCNAPLYLRVDDDMMLHWLSAEYMVSRATQTSEKVAYYMCHLYEPATSKVVRGIKVYRLDAARDIGYEPDKFGKIDKNFLRIAKKKGYKVKIDPSIAGIHATSDWEDEKLYQGLWIANSPKGIPRELTRCKMSVDEQVKMAGKFTGKKNINEGTAFGKMIRNHK